MKGKVMIGIFMLVSAIVVIITLSLCKAAGDADRYLEEINNNNKE